MILLVEKLARSLKPPFKLENHHSKALPVSLHAFESEISKALTQFSLNSSKSRSEILTLSWVQQCLQLLPILNKALAKLAAEIDYPMSSWEVYSVEEYLRDSLNLLEHLNSITSSIVHLGQARLSLSHALSLTEKSPSLAMERLKPIQPWSTVSKNCSAVEDKRAKGEKGCCSDKEIVIHEALKVIKSVWLWVCTVVESSLCGNAQSCSETVKAIDGFVNSSLMGSNLSVICEEMETEGLLKEVREVNDGVVRLLVALGSGGSSDVVEELQRKVIVFGEALEGVGQEVNRLFSEVLMGRNELLNGYQQRRK